MLRAVVLRAFGKRLTVQCLTVQCLAVKRLTVKRLVMRWLVGVPVEVVRAVVVLRLRRRGRRRGLAPLGGVLIARPQRAVIIALHAQDDNQA
ncbi:hypothetical protein FHR34_006074 [Kitasatospora kifunensis]|uniref:Uncharacterized protein n=1 Tax=Kitasatospora kifunensis TaxID=58351 RepID=A0A7W7R811_KITKI|nr:hypothetical protein [Kitasatospora kifunensis]